MHAHNLKSCISPWGCVWRNWPMWEESSNCRASGSGRTKGRSPFFRHPHSGLFLLGSKAPHAGGHSCYQGDPIPPRSLPHSGTPQDNLLYRPGMVSGAPKSDNPPPESFTGRLLLSCHSLVPHWLETEMEATDHGRSNLRRWENLAKSGTREDWVLE